MIITDILERAGLKYEDLTSAEKETLEQWSTALEGNTLTPNDISRHITTMRGAVEEKLAVTGLGSKEDTFLKARLRNYMLLEAFLISPEKAKEALDKALAGLVSGRKV